jgi:hypothetical protein
MRESDTLEFGNVAEELYPRDRLLIRGDYHESELRRPPR